MPYQPNREELAWAAGFFDGEGCTTYHLGKHQRKYPRLRVSQSGNNGNELLERFKNAIGFGIVYGPYKIAKNQTKIRWVFQVTGFEKVQATISLLWDWLGTEKRNQAVKILKGE